MTTIFNTIEVNTGKVARIINFLNSSPEFFIAIGNPSPWNGTYGLNISDTNPPFPLETETKFLNPIVYKRINIGVGAQSIVAAASLQNQCSNDFNNNESVLSSVTLVQETTAQRNLTFYTLQDLIDNQALNINHPEFIYIQGEILDTEYSTSSWRTSALFTKLFLKPGVNPNLQLYTPDQVTGGLMHHLTYNSPVLRQTGKKHKFEYIINV